MTCRRPNKPMSAKVTSITTDGFWLCISDTEYFVAFTHFPWFRYADDCAIETINVFYCGLDDNDGEFMVHWPLLDVHLGTNHIKWHSENPIKHPHCIRYPSLKGKLTDRLTDTCTFEKQYEVNASFTFNGTFTVKAEDANMAREMVAQLCFMRLGDAVINVQIPFDEIRWDFTRNSRSNADINNVSLLE